MTADISSTVAEKAVCWCEGRKNRRSLVMGRRFTLAAPAFVPVRETISFKAYQRLASATEFSRESGRDGSLIDTGASDRRMTSRANVLWMNDLPVDAELIGV